MNSMLEPEWLQLILQAKQLGLTIEEVREFFKEKTVLKGSYKELTEFKTPSLK